MEPNQRGMGSYSGRAAYESAGIVLEMVVLMKRRGRFMVELSNHIIMIKEDG